MKRTNCFRHIGLSVFAAGFFAVYFFASPPPLFQGKGDLSACPGGLLKSDHKASGKSLPADCDLMNLPARKESTGQPESLCDEGYYWMGGEAWTGDTDGVSNVWGAGGSLYFSSASDPTNAVEVWWADIPLRIRIHNSKAYVFCYWGLDVLDVSNPIMPSSLGNYSSFGYSDGIWDACPTPDDSCIIMSDQNTNGLKFLKRATREVLWTVPNPNGGFYTGMFVDDAQQVLIAGDIWAGCFDFYDISDLDCAGPVFIGRIYDQPGPSAYPHTGQILYKDGTLYGNYEPWQQYHPIIYSGWYGDGWSEVSVWNVPDVHNPESSSFVKFYRTNYDIVSMKDPGHGIALAFYQNRIAHYQDRFQSLVNIGYFGTSSYDPANGVAICDMGVGPNGGFALGGARGARFFNSTLNETSHRWTGGRSCGIVPSGDHLFVPSGYAGLGILDNSDPTAPVTYSALEPDPTQFKSVSLAAVSPDGKYAYISDGSTYFWVADLTDLANPVLVKSGTVPLRCTASGNVTSMLAIGSYLYVGTASTIDLFDVATAPSHPVPRPVLLDSDALNGACAGIRSFTHPSYPGQDFVCVLGPDTFNTFKVNALLTDTGHLSAGEFTSWYPCTPFNDAAFVGTYAYLTDSCAIIYPLVLTANSPAVYFTISDSGTTPLGLNYSPGIYYIVQSSPHMLAVKADWDTLLGVDISAPLAPLLKPDWQWGEAFAISEMTGLTNHDGYLYFSDRYTGTKAVYDKPDWDNPYLTEPLSVSPSFIDGGVAYLNGTVEVSVKVKDDTTAIPYVGFYYSDDGYHFHVLGQVIKSTPAGEEGTYTYSWDTSKWTGSPGPLLILVLFQDSGCNDYYEIFGDYWINKPPTFDLSWDPGCNQPQFNGVCPPAGWTVCGNLCFTVTAAANPNNRNETCPYPDEISQIAYAIDGGEWQLYEIPGEHPNPLPLCVDTTSLTGGPHTMTVRVTDTCGFQTFKDTNGISAWTFTVDNTGTPASPLIMSISDVDACAQNGIRINFAAGAGAATHDLYRDDTLVAPDYVSGTTYNPGDGLQHSYFVRALNATECCFTDSAPYLFMDADNTPGAPSPFLFEDIDPCALSGVVLTWDAVPGGTGYDLLVDSVTTVHDVNSPFTYNPGDANPHNYQVRTKNSTCESPWSEAVTGVDVNIAPGTPIIDSVADASNCGDGVVITWGDVPGASLYDLNVDSSTIVTGVASPYMYIPGDGSVHSYQVRAKKTYSSLTSNNVQNLGAESSDNRAPDTLDRSESCPTLNNTGFETGDLAGWTIDGINNTPFVNGVNPHSGTYSARLGNFDPEGEPGGNSSFYQQITLPVTASTLSFWFWPYATDSISYDWQDVYIQDTAGNTLAVVMHYCRNEQAWINQTFDLASYAGQTIRVKFLVHQDGWGDETAMYVDDVQLICSCPTITFSPPLLSDGVMNTVYNHTITASGATAPYVFAVSSGTLPPGISLTSSGILSGTPTMAGNYDITIKATDANECSEEIQYSLTIYSVCTSPWSNALTAADVNDLPGTPAITDVQDVDSCSLSGVGVTWGAVSGATGYDLYVDSAAIVPSVTSPYLYNPGDTSNHNYQVRAKNASCTGAWSAVVAGTDANNAVGAPAISSVVDVSACAESGVTIAWGAVSGATGYDLYVDSTTIVTTVTSPYVHDPGDTSSHNYQVRAKNASCTGSWSAVVAGTDVNSGVSSPTISSVVDVSACAQSGVTITWGAVSGATGYDLYIDSATTVANVTSPYAHNPGNTNSHNYQVRAKNASCTGSWSTAVPGTDVNSMPGIPAISGITDYSTCGSGIEISWDAVTGATGYDLYVDATTTVTDVTSPYSYSPGNTNSHNYQIRAKNASCTGSWSAVVAGTDVNNNPAQPVISVDDATPCAFSGVIITWGAVSGATSYDLFDGLTGVASGISSPYTYHPGDSNSHNYKIKARNALCPGGIFSNTVAGIDSNSGVASPTITGVNDINECAMSGIIISWGSVSGATGYDLLVDFSSTVENIASPYTYLPGNTSSHHYQVRAKNSICASSWSGGAYGTDANSGPAAPASPAVSDINVCSLTGVTVTWGSVSGATGYDLFVDATTTVSNVTSPYTYAPGDSSVHNYQVRAKNASCTGLWSTAAAGTDANGLGTPAIIGVNDVDSCSTSGVTITWGAVGGATGFDLYVDSTTTVTTVTSPYTYSPGNNSSHNYQVRAKNASCTGAWSAVVAGTDANNAVGAPTISSVVDVSACAQSGVTITWGAVSGATGYDLYVDSTTTVTTVTSPYVHNPGNTSSHNYQVRAKNASCTGSWSAVVSKADADSTPSAPSAPVIEDVDGCVQSGVTITWGAVSGATGYDLYVDSTTTITGVTSPHAYNPGNNASHNYQVRAKNASCTGSWSSATAGTDAANSKPSAPMISAVTDWDPSCSLRITFSSGSPATQHDLYVDGGLVQSNVASPAYYYSGDTASHSFVVRAINSGCYTDSAPLAGSDSNCGGSFVPPEIQGLMCSSSTAYWQPDPSAASYKLYRGVIADLPSHTACIKYDTGDTIVDITSDDPSSVAGRCYWYIVTGYNLAGEGPPAVMSSGGCF